MTLDHIAVVGASAAGNTAAHTLRRAGFAGRITVIGAERHPPYDRPPLTKQFLTGAWTPQRLQLPAAAEVFWRLGVTATGLDTQAGVVLLDDGSHLAYDGLVIATGVAPRRLPFGVGLAGIHYIRTLDDTLSLREDLLSSTDLVVVGAGFLGAEAAAAARTLGKSVTLIEQHDGVMTAQLGPATGALLTRLHEEHGVNVLTGRGVTSFTGAEGRVTGVALTDGSSLPAETVLVAIGSVPATGWLTGSGLSVTDGVDCDVFLQAGPRIVAAGDVANWPHPTYRRRLRLEHRMNATEQAAQAARTLLGDRQHFAPVPYFWTDQYDNKIQAYGHWGPEAEFKVAEGSTSRGAFIATLHEQGSLAGILAWNMPRQLRQLRETITMQQTLE
ncbi:NAD(P)/FAD-dependent oxidoreductase [Streptomyces chartreusis]|uniref:NAD(P)/FAD-dependent oxidoreductase n=1 Tax=Streptomyces chartreusis TaxID=1969 RepID=UPI00372339D5